MFKLLTKWAMDAHMQKNKNQEAIEAYDELVSEIRKVICFRMEEIKKETFVVGPFSPPFFGMGVSYTKMVFYRKGYVVLETKDPSKLLFKKRRKVSKFKGFDLWYNKIPSNYLEQAKELLKIQGELENDKT